MVSGSISTTLTSPPFTFKTSPTDRDCAEMGVSSLDGVNTSSINLSCNSSPLSGFLSVALSLSAFPIMGPKVFDVPSPTPSVS